MKTKKEYTFFSIDLTNSPAPEETFELKINEFAKDGWRYVDTIPYFLSKHSNTASYLKIIFERDVTKTLKE